MSVMFVLIGVSLLVAAGFLIVFIWSLRNGQYDDEYADAVRPLFDDPVNSKQIANTPSSDIKNKN